MLEINFKDLVESYSKNLLDDLRGFGTNNEFLKFWVPTANDDLQSFKNLVDALVENNNTYFIIKLDKKKFDSHFKDEIKIYLDNFSKIEQKDNNNHYLYLIEINIEKYKKLFSKVNKVVKKKIIQKQDVKNYIKINYENKNLFDQYELNLEFLNPKSFYIKDFKETDSFLKEKIFDHNFFMKIEKDIIKSVFHDCSEKSIKKKVLDLFCELIINKNIQEASDHSVIYLEEKIRLVKKFYPKKGIILPFSVGKYFYELNSLIRLLFKNYKMQNNKNFDINRDYYEVTDRWKKESYQNKINKINGILLKIIKDNKDLNDDSVLVNKIDNHFKIYLKIDKNFTNLLKNRNLLLEIEIKLKNLDNALEVFVDEILDQNKLRLKNSPQNLVI